MNAVVNLVLSVVRKCRDGTKKNQAAGLKAYDSNLIDVDYG
jgi:hypothetical protein